MKKSTISLYVLALSVCLPTTSEAFFLPLNPINDVTDRILVLGRRDPWGNFHALADSVSDMQSILLSLWLAELTEQLEYGGDRCESSSWASAPFSHEDALQWNAALSSPGRFSWAPAAIGGGAGAMLGASICTGPLFAPCIGFFGGLGGIAADALDRFLNDPAYRPPQVLPGCSVAVLQQTCDLGGRGLGRLGPQITLTSLSWARSCP